MLYTATYATSAQVLPAVQAAKVPVVILNLQPTRSLDYETMTTGEWLANCSACCVPELAGAFTRARVPYHTVTGTLLPDDPALGSPAPTGSRRRPRRARVQRGALRLPRPQLSRHARHVLRFHADPGAGRLARRECSRSTIWSPGSKAPRRPRSRPRARRFAPPFEFAVPGADPIADEIEPERFEWSARVAVGLDRLVSRLRRWTGSPTTTAASTTTSTSASAPALIVGNSLLTARGIPTAGEADLKTNVAMLLLDRLGAGGSYTEFYALDFDEQFVLDGP